MNVLQAPTGPRNMPTGGRGGRGGSGGIGKRGRGRGLRTDKDGDLDMDSALKRRGGNSGISKGGRTNASVRGGKGGSQRAAPVNQRSARSNVPNADNKTGLVEVKVFGWGNSAKDREDVVDFLEQRANCRVKKSKSTGKLLTLHIPYAQVSSVLAQDNIAYRQTFLTITAPRYVPIDKNEVAEKTIKAATPASSRSTGDTVEALNKVLISRYNAEAKLLDLSNLASDPVLQEQGFFQQASTRSKMFPAMMLVADKHFKTQQEKKEAVHSVSLAFNGLPNINTVASLSMAFPDLKNLSLEGNNIQNWNDLGAWRFRFRDLEQLVLLGNPIANVDRYVEECVRIWPKLLMLDNVVIDRSKFSLPPPPPPPAPRVEEQKAVGIVNNPTLTGFPLGIKPGFIQDSGEVGMKFLAEFFTNYDDNKTKLLADYYDDDSVFTLSANTLAPRVEQPGVKIPPRPWEVYYTVSRNLHRAGSSHQPRRYFKGATAIRKLWGDLPRTRHDVSNAEHWVYDLWPVEGLPDPNNPNNVHGVTGILINVHGELQELGAPGIKRSFDRSFTLGPGKTATSVRVINDMLTVRPYGGIDAWKPTPDPVIPGMQPAPVIPVIPTVPVPNPAEQAELIRNQKLGELYNMTNLTEAYTIMCFDEAGGDLQKAYASYEQAKIAGALPAEAYRS